MYLDTVGNIIVSLQNLDYLPCLGIIDEYIAIIAASCNKIIIVAQKNGLLDVCLYIGMACIEQHIQSCKCWRKATLCSSHQLCSMDEEIVFCCCLQPLDHDFQLQQCLLDVCLHIGMACNQQHAQCHCSMTAHYRIVAVSNQHVSVFCLEAAWMHTSLLLRGGPCALEKWPPKRNEISVFTLA